MIACSNHVRCVCACAWCTAHVRRVCARVYSCVRVYSSARFAAAATMTLCGWCARADAASRCCCRCCCFVSYTYTHPNMHGGACMRRPHLTGRNGSGSIPNGGGNCSRCSRRSRSQQQPRPYNDRTRTTPSQRRRRCERAHTKHNNSLGLRTRAHARTPMLARVQLQYPISWKSLPRSHQTHAHAASGDDERPRWHPERAHHTHTHACAHNNTHAYKYGAYTYTHARRQCVVYVYFVLYCVARRSSSPPFLKESMQQQRLIQHTAHRRR